MLVVSYDKPCSIYLVTCVILAAICVVSLFSFIFYATGLETFLRIQCSVYHVLVFIGVLCSTSVVIVEKLTNEY